MLASETELIRGQNMQIIQTNQKTITIATIIVILALGASFLVWKNEKNASQQQVQNQEQQKNEQKESGQDVIDMSDWKIYRNEEYGIEFKYPENLLYVKEIIDSANTLYIDIIQNGRKGTDVDKLGRMSIILNDFANMKYGVAKKDGLCENVDVLGQRGEVCDEKKSDKGKARDDFLAFVQKGTCSENVGAIFFEPQYSNKGAFGMNTIYILCDKDDQKITSVFQKIYQSISFTKR